MARKLFLTFLDVVYLYLQFVSVFMIKFIVINVVNYIGGIYYYFYLVIDIGSIWLSLKTL